LDSNQTKKEAWRRKNANKISVSKLDSKRQLGRPRADGKIILV
jgi:hypothetical protein